MFSCVWERGVKYNCLPPGSVHVAGIATVKRPDCSDPGEMTQFTLFSHRSSRDHTWPLKLL